MMVDLPSYGYTGRIRLGSFLRQRPLILNYDGSEKLTDFQVKCTLTPSDIPFEKLRADKQDLLFVDNNNDPIPYWIEKADTSGIEVWLKFSEISKGKEVFWLYYGNENFSGASDGEATFEFFDDFEDGVVDTSKWQDWDGTASESDGELLLSENANDLHFYSTITFGMKYIIRTRYLRGYDGGLFFNVQDANNGYLIALRDPTFPEDKFQFWKREAGSWSSLGSINPSVDTSWHIFELKVRDRNYEIYEDGDSKLSATDATWTSGYVGIRGRMPTPTQTDWFLIRKYAEAEPTIMV